MLVVAGRPPLITHSQSVSQSVSASEAPSPSELFQRPPSLVVVVIVAGVGWLVTYWSYKSVMHTWSSRKEEALDFMSLV